MAAYEDEPVSIEEILGKYKAIDMDSPPPDLTPGEVGVITDYYKELGMKMLAGSWGRPGVPVSALVGSDLNLRRAGMDLGPYIINDSFKPSGIGQWGVKQFQ